MAILSAALPSLLGGLAATVIANTLLKKEAPSQPVQQAQTPVTPVAVAAPVAAAAEAPPPTVEEPTKMPTINDAERRAATRRSIALQMARRGRASTILTNDADAKLGG